MLQMNPGSVRRWRKLDIVTVFSYTEIDKALLTAPHPLPVIPGLFVTHEQLFGSRKGGLRVYPTVG